MFILLLFCSSLCPPSLGNAEADELDDFINQYFGTEVEFRAWLAFDRLFQEWWKKFQEKEKAAGVQEPEVEPDLEEEVQSDEEDRFVEEIRGRQVRKVDRVSLFHAFIFFTSITLFPPQTIPNPVLEKKDHVADFLSSQLMSPQRKKLSPIVVKGYHTNHRMYTLPLHTRWDVYAYYHSLKMNHLRALSDSAMHEYRYLVS